MVELAGSGPVLLLIPGTLGARGDIFWQQMDALKGPRAALLAVTYPKSGGVARVDRGEFWGDIIALLGRAPASTRRRVLGSSLGGYFAFSISAPPIRSGWRG